MSAKRALFTTPSRSNKRRKTTKKSAPMRIPKSLLPEMKQFTKDGLSASTNYAYSSIYSDMTQGDDADDFIGSKFTLKRLRVIYDYSDLAASLSEGVRISVVIPKNPSSLPTLTNHIKVWDTQQFTVLFDRILPKDASMLAGTFDVTGPIHMEGINTGTTPLRNNVHIYVHSANNGSNIGNVVRVSYQMWYTDA